MIQSANLPLKTNHSKSLEKTTDPVSMISCSVCTRERLGGLLIPQTVTPILTFRIHNQEQVIQTL